MSGFEHLTVLQEAAAEAVLPRAGGVYVDVTSGGGGHGAELLKRSGPDGRLLAFDRDPVAVGASRERLAPFGARAAVEQAVFSEVEARLAAQGIGPGGVDGIVADLGVSSPQIDTGDRGFSFMVDGPLDMRMSGDGPTAAELIDAETEESLTRIFREFGEIRDARRLARAAKAEREAGRLRTTREFSALCSRVLGKGRRNIDPATLPFQALRIAVNRELEELDALLDAIPRLLAPGGRAAIITFHSLEDRRVKHAFRALSTTEAPPRGVPIVGDGPVAPFRLVGASQTPADEEITANPRARSARLRIIQRRVQENTND